MSFTVVDIILMIVFVLMWLYFILLRLMKEFRKKIKNDGDINNKMTWLESSFWMNFWFIYYCC